MGLASTWAADQHHIVRAVDEGAAMQLLDCGLIDLAGGKVEAGQILVGREAGPLEVIGDGPDLPLGKLSLEQLGEDRHSRIEGRGTLFDQLVHGLGHAIHLEAAQHDHYGSAGGIMTHGADPCRAAHRSARRWLWAPVAGSEPEAHRSTPPHQRPQQTSSPRRNRQRQQQRSTNATNQRQRQKRQQRLR